MTVEIITIGDEILIGQIVDTNSQWMADQLLQIGLRAHKISTIKDEQQAIRTTLKRALKESDIVLITGGLGPTNDDVTKNALTSFFETKLVFNESVFEDVKAVFERIGVLMPEVNKEQAMVPESCIPIKNHIGTAPGMLFHESGKIVVSMPGVPVEMKDMMKKEVLPFIAQNTAGVKRVEYTILTRGLGESSLMERIRDWQMMIEKEGAKLAYLPSIGKVRLRIGLEGNDLDAINQQIEKWTADLHKIIPGMIYGLGDRSLQDIVGEILRQRRKTVSAAESCTGGYLSHLITSVPGSSAYFPGGLITYSNQEKISLLNVSENTIALHGAVSMEVVSEMATNVRKLMNTDYGVAISGIAGPDGGTEEKPVGTVWIAVAGKNGLKARKYNFLKDRMTNIKVSAETALHMLRKELISA